MDKLERFTGDRQLGRGQTADLVAKGEVVLRAMGKRSAPVNALEQAQAFELLQVFAHGHFGNLECLGQLGDAHASAGF